MKDSLYDETVNNVLEHGITDNEDDDQQQNDDDDSSSMDEEVLPGYKPGERDSMVLVGDS